MIIGNPPYVEYSKVKKEYTIRGYETEPCGNLYAMTIERSFNLIKNTNPVGMIVQLPLVCTDRMLPAQSLFKFPKRKSWFANFDDRPGKLFDDLQHIRATIFLSKKEMNMDKGTLYATKYKRWYTKVRSILFESLTFEDITDICIEGSFPKISDSLGKGLASKLRNIKKPFLNFKTGKCVCYFHSSPQYWIRAMDFVPYFWSEQYGEKISPTIKALYFDSKLDASVTIATLNSSLFYWWFIVFSSCRSLTLREVRSFPIGVREMEISIKQQLFHLTEDLMVDLKHNAHRKETTYKTTGRVVYDEFYPRRSKHIIDEIDKVLAEHYGFTDEELDFIINYDIKYRMGLGN